MAFSVFTVLYASIIPFSLSVCLSPTHHHPPSSLFLSAPLRVSLGPTTPTSSNANKKNRRPQPVGGLKARDTPQIVLLTFDDSVNDLNKELYRDLFDTGRKNPNGCPLQATFYVSHEWTDYGQVQSLYAAGHEIASHTIS